MIDPTQFAAMPQPVQAYYEWLTFLNFCQAYFSGYGIQNPLVVEIGVNTNAQKKFYEQFLSATHIGIDNRNQFSEPDILGDSYSPTTINKLVEMLKGRPIDLLFIDGDHSYEGVKQDYEIFGQMTKHIIAFHDIFVVPDVKQFWAELRPANPNYEFMDFEATEKSQFLCGIGVMVKYDPDGRSVFCFKQAWEYTK